VDSTPPVDDGRRATLTADIQAPHTRHGAVVATVADSSEEAIISDIGQDVRGRGPVVVPAPELRLDAAVLSITGARPENEDAAFAGPDVLVVADGVGGNVGGAVASTSAVEAVRDVVQQQGARVSVDQVRSAVEAASARLARAVAADPGLAGMATTLTAVAVSGGRLGVAHVGDTRAYLLRNGRLRQLTRDQTVVQSLVDAGVVTPELVRTHPLRSVLLGALRGADGDLRHLALSSEDLRCGDRLLLCSDGLCGVVDAKLIERILIKEGAPTAATRRLVRAALAAGTRDNVTVVVADVVTSASAGLVTGGRGALAA
jgi:PPM family protein phosphatase